jgi:hypothetical protein
MGEQQMVEETLKRYADDITLQELVRLRVENDKLKERIETLQDVVRENHDTTLEIFKERERLREVVRLLIEYEEHDEAIHRGATLWETLIDKARAELKGDE